MNFLAHIFLSGDSEELLIGNFIGDYVKGRNYIKYPGGIRQGILLHRSIDSFTDRHRITRESKSIIREKYQLYAGIVIDIFYDHFLANNWNRFSEESLDHYINDRYDILCKYFHLFPSGVKRFFPYFVRSNWLQSYASLEGLESVLRRMSYRTSLPEYSGYAIEQITSHYDELQQGFIRFFGEIIDYVTSEYDVKL